jgi:hypothetical protein
VCRSWVDYSFEGMKRQRLVNQVLGNMIHLHHPGVVTLPGNGRRVITTTLDHYQFAPDGDYGTTQGAMLHDFWINIFSMHVSCCIFCFAVTFPIAQNEQPPGAHT